MDDIDQLHCDEDRMSLSDRKQPSSVPKLVVPLGQRRAGLSVDLGDQGDETRGR